MQYCTHGDQPMTREPNGVSMREYDRCLPTLAAFKTPQAAEAYQQQHGGRVLSYAEALATCASNDFGRREAPGHKVTGTLCLLHF